MHRLRFIVLAFCVALAGCAGMTAAQVLAQVDSVLNGACASLTFLPYEVAVCAGVQGAEAISNLIVGYVHASQKAQLAAALGSLRRKANPQTSLVKIKGLPAYAPPELAGLLNEPAENAKLHAYIAAGLASDAGADASDGGK